MSEWEEHQVIYLQPWCDDCDKHAYEGRVWCQDDAWSECEECGKKPARYVLAKEAGK